MLINAPFAAQQMTRFSLDCWDGELSTRMSPEEWRRVLVLRDHPRMLDGLLRYGQLMTAYFAGNTLLNKVVTEAWRFETLVYALHLHDTRDPADPQTGLTLSRLKRLCAIHKCASPGRVLALIGIMQVAGFLKRKRSDVDSRIVHLEPSDGFVKIVEGWNQQIFQIIDEILPHDRLALCHRAHPRFGWEMRRRGAETVLAGWKLLDPFPEVMHFLSRDGAWMLLLHCASETMQHGNREHIVPVSVDLKAFGQRYGVSRSHLRRVLETGHLKGLLLAPPQNGACIVLAPHLLASFLTCMASELGHYRLWALEARKVLGVDEAALLVA